MCFLVLFGVREGGVGCVFYVCFIFVFCAALIGGHQLFKNTPAGARSKMTGAKSALAGPAELRESLACICLHCASMFYLSSFISLRGEFQTLIPDLKSILFIKEYEIQMIAFTSVP